MRRTDPYCHRQLTLHRRRAFEDAARRLEQFASTRLLSALWQSLLVSGSTALVAGLRAFLLAYAARSTRSRLIAAAGRFASFGYGVPGTVLAMGVLIPLATLPGMAERTVAVNSMW